MGKFTTIFFALFFSVFVLQSETQIVKNADWYLDQGDKAAATGNVTLALEQYQKALALEPKNLVVQEKCSEMKKIIAGGEQNDKFVKYLKNADANYKKNDIKFAFLYLIEGLRAYPDGRAEVMSRLEIMMKEHPREIEALLAEKSKELKDMNLQIGHMEENATTDKTTVGASDAPEVRYSEPYLQKIASKAERIYPNEKGFWEAIFLGDITMIYIPAGEFMIGSPKSDGDADEHPAHMIAVPGFWIGKTEVTFEQYDRFCVESGREKVEDEGWGRGNRPAIYISWKDADDFCAWLNEKTGLAFRLPTEAEWEKAARDRFPWGNSLPTVNHANFNKNSMQTSPVGSYRLGASPYGVLDMAGNVWEWMADWYDAGYYRNSSRENPQGPGTGSERVVRGGSWANNNDLVRSANRSSENPTTKLNILGFRLALTAAEL